MELPRDPAFYCSLDPIEEAKFIHLLHYETAFRNTYGDDWSDEKNDFVAYTAYSLDWAVSHVWVVFVSVETRLTSVGEIRDFGGVRSNRYFGELTCPVVARYLISAETLRAAFRAACERFQPEVHRWQDERRISQITVNLDRAEMISVAELYVTANAGGIPHLEPAALNALRRLAEVIAGSGGYAR